MHSVLSTSVVGVWATPLPGIPKLPQQTLANLFGDPYLTNIGLGPDGSLMVQKMGKPPTPTVLFGQARFQVQCPTAEETSKVLSVLMQEAYDRTNQQIPYLSQLGLNSEHEWLRKGFVPSKGWLGNQYIRKGLTHAPAALPLDVLTLNFVVTFHSPDRTYNIQLQPRAEKDHGVFAAINDHRAWNQAAPSGDVVLGLLKDSLREIDDRVAPLILGGVDDD